MKRVLLLDDDPIQLSVRQLLLRRGGVESEVATSAQEALELLTAKSFGAVITDHLMPDINGDEFVRKLRLLDERMPVIVVSGLPDIDDAYRGLDVVILCKP